MTALSMRSSVLEQVKKREHKNPDQIDKVPEKPAHFDAISKVFWIALVKPLADRQPHVNEHEDAAEHVHAVQACNGEITREIRVVRRQKHRRALDVFPLDRCDIVGDWQREKVR